jgi:hypothetical protein
MLSKFYLKCNFLWPSPRPRYLQRTQMPIDAKNNESSKIEIDDDSTTTSCFNQWSSVTTCHGAGDISRVLLLWILRESQNQQINYVNAFYEYEGTASWKYTCFNYLAHNLKNKQHAFPPHLLLHFHTFGHSIHTSSTRCWPQTAVVAGIFH